ncbi:MAG: secretin N-terminal domain-containing protein, partial [Candidatus Hydrogenedentota bacterium]
MFRLCRGRWVLGALVSLTSTTWAASNVADEYLQRKHDAIQPHAVDLIERYGSAAFDDALERASSLYGINVDSSSTSPGIQLEMSNAAQITLDKSDTRLTVDLYGIIVLNDLNWMHIDGGNILADIELTQLATDPQFTARLTLTTKTAFSVSIKSLDTGLLLTLTSPDETLDRALETVSTANHALRIQTARNEYRLRKADVIESMLSEFHSLTQAIDQSAQAVKLRVLQSDLAGLSPEQGAGIKPHNADMHSVDARVQAAKRSFAYYNRLYTQSPQSTSLKDAVSAHIAKLDEAIAGMEQSLTVIQVQTGVAKRVSAQVAQNTVTPLLSNAGFSEFDAALNNLRSASSSTADTNSTLDAFDTALLSVNDATPELVLPEVSSAALRNTLGQSTAPTKRARPAPHSLTAASIANPAKMKTLLATPEELELAESQGMFLMAQADGTDVITNESRPEPRDASRSRYQPRRMSVTGRETRPDFNLYTKGIPADEDPLRALVSINFKDMDLANVVQLLALKGEINVIAGTEISGSVTANLKDIPLGRAIEIVLRMNGLGIVEESGVYRITTYQEAVASRHDTELVFLQTAEAEAIKATLEEITQNAGGSGSTGERVRIGANTQSNIIVISGPSERVNELIDIIEALDVAEPIIPTVNKVLQLNYADPEEMAKIIDPIMSENGQVTAEVRAGQLIITDIPVKVAELSALVAELDVPVEQVSIEAMIVDQAIKDDSASGVTWSAISDSLLPSSTGTSERNRFRASVGGAPADVIGGIGFGFVSGAVEVNALVNAEVQSGNAELIANPTIVTLENKVAVINISQEYPYTT